MSSGWRVHRADPRRSDALAQALGVHPRTAQIVLNRGLQGVAEARRFFMPSLDAGASLPAIPGLVPAVARLRRAIDRREPVLIFSDSDVDGLTASVILYEVLAGQGGVVRAQPSNRIADGYGFPRAAAQAVARSRTALVVLVDCGTNQAEEVQLLMERGIDVIVVDHHAPLEAPAQPTVLVNPRATRDAVGQELCSAGLAFVIARGLLAEEPLERLARYLDLAALGTLADCSPLVGESRVIVAEGLTRILNSGRSGLRQLCAATKTSEPEPDHILRRLVPRLNASGRLGDAGAVWHLLREGEDARIERWLASAESAHAQTKQLYRRVVAEAEGQVQRMHFRDELVVVVSGERWHRGLMGPLAAQLAQRYGRPAIAIALEEHHGVGSGRSVPMVNLLDVLRPCRELLLRFGGHAQACGLTVARKQLALFRERVNREARLLVGGDGLMATRLIDLELGLEAMGPSWVKELKQLAPFGQGNPRPTILLRGLHVEVRSPRVGVLSDGTRHVAARGRLSACAAPGRYDVVVSPSGGEGSVVLTVSDARDAAVPSGLDRTEGTGCRRGPA